MSSLASRFLTISFLRLALGAGLFAGASLQAQTHEALFSGTLHSFSPGVLSATDGSVTYGTPFSVIVRFDIGASAFFSNGAERVGYQATTIPSHIVVSFGNYQFTTDGFRAFINNDNDGAYDGFEFRSTLTTSVADDGFRVVAGGLAVQLFTTNTATYTSTALDNVLLGTPIGDFDYTGSSDLSVTLGYGTGYSSTGTAYGTITSYSVSAVPEPSTYALLTGAGALGLAWWRRRGGQVTANTDGR